MRLLLLSLTAGLVSAATVVPLDGCQQLRYDRSAPLFIGEVLSRHVTPSTAGIVRYRIVEAFRGVPSVIATVDVAVKDVALFLPAHRYLLKGFADSASRPVAEYQDDIRVFRGVLIDKLPRHIRGRVSAVRYPLAGIAHDLYRLGETKPLANAEVTATIDGHTYRTRTSADGSYILLVPRPGVYSVLANFKDYTGEVARTEVVDDGCAISELGVYSRSTVSGQVRDSRGHPMSGANVELVDQERAGAPLLFGRWLRATTDARGNFTITNVPTGKFLLAVRPSGRPPSVFRPIRIQFANEHLRGRDLVLDP